MIETKLVVIAVVLVSGIINLAYGREDIWNKVHCNQLFQPDYCNYTDLSGVTIEEMDRCAPALLEIKTRDYYLGAAGRRTTYKDNKDAFDRIRLQPRLLRGISQPNPETYVLGERVDFPIGLCPTGKHMLVDPEGEKATAKGLSGLRTVMILSSLATVPLEEVAEAARSLPGVQPRLWMQTYIFLNRSNTIEIVQRAERSGFEAIVMTTDLPIPSQLACIREEGFADVPQGAKSSIGGDKLLTLLDADQSVNFDDIQWLKKYTSLPIIVKGILSGDDARRAADAGATAIMVSNHGGRHLDGDLATIDALPDVVRAVRSMINPPEVYLDGGVRSGHDVFKAIARGAQMVFVGRPQIWGLAYAGSDGVNAVVRKLAQDFTQTMTFAGVPTVSDITPDLLLPSRNEL